MRGLVPLVPAALGLAAVLAGCAQQQIPLEEAEAVCARRALGPGPSNSAVSFGVGGVVDNVGLGVSMSPNYYDNRDPAEIYQSCVIQKSGQRPRRPLYPSSNSQG